MSRIRTIKPEFWVSEQVAACSLSARLTFVGMWNFCDDNGVHQAKPKTLMAELYPMDDITPQQVAGWVDELVSVGLVAEFRADDGNDYWHVTGWGRHQRIDRPSAKHPAPPAKDSTMARLAFDESSPNTHRGVAESSPIARRSPPPGEDRRGEDRKGEEMSSPKARATADKSSAGTRLPKDWVLPDSWRLYCVENRPDLDPKSVAENFRDYWHAKAGKGGVKVDWKATWNTWVRKENGRPSVATGAASGRRSALHADDLIGAAS